MSWCLVKNRFRLRFQRSRSGVTRATAPIWSKWRGQNRSVGDLVREAVAVQYGVAGVKERVKAIEALARVNAPVGEPEELEAEIRKGALER